jgi:hypothetical protein
MAPQTLLLMRHAEKPIDEGDPHLSASGLARAKALPGRVESLIGGAVQFIFAAKQSPHSNRPVETVTPLSASAGVSINSEFADRDYATLAKRLLDSGNYRDTRIVVCWHHDSLPGFAGALGAAAGSYPNPWPGQIFDLILLFEWDRGALSVTKSWDK